MSEDTKHDNTTQTQPGTDTKGSIDSPSRRRVMTGGATALAGLALMSRSPRIFAQAPEKELRIGYVSPRSGALGSFGQADPYIIKLARQVFAKGIDIRGQHYKVKIFDHDSQSSPARASQLARQLITEKDIHLMLATATPETVNPVADACEAASVPCIANDCPLESFFFGRGGKPGQPSPFKWSFDFSFGIRQFAAVYLSLWSQLKTNKKVAVMYPNDADGNGFRNHLIPVFEKNGYTVIDPGPYQDGTTDYSSQIALFRREHCQIFNTVGLPPDFGAFWRQAAQLNYAQSTVIVTSTKGDTPNVEALGSLGYRLTGARFWLPVYPYDSPLTGATSQQLADDYQKATGRQWVGTLGASLSLFEVAAAVFKAAKDPTNRSDIRDVIPTLDMVTSMGRVNFKTGPYPNTAATPMIGAQWIKAKPGSKWPLDMVSVEHAGDPNIPVQRALTPYGSKQS